MRNCCKKTLTTTLSSTRLFKRKKIFSTFYPAEAKTLQVLTPSQSDHRMGRTKGRIKLVFVCSAKQFFLYSKPMESHHVFEAEEGKTRSICEMDYSASRVGLEWGWATLEADGKRGALERYNNASPFPAQGTIPLQLSTSVTLVLTI